MGESAKKSRWTLLPQFVTEDELVKSREIIKEILIRELNGSKKIP